MASIIPLGLLALVIVSIIAYQVQQRRSFVERARVSAAAVVRSEGGLLSMPEIAIRDRNTSVTLRPAGGGKNNPARWDMEVIGLRLGARTSLTVGKEGVFSALSKMLNFHDVQIGQPDIDDTYLIKGSAPDVIRGAFGHRPLVDALHGLFERRRVFKLALQPSGRLDVSVGRSRFAFDEALQVASAVLRVCEALDEAADLDAVPEPVPERVPHNLSASGPSSGTPVGIGFRE